MRIQSNDIVILDTTDSKKIDLHISSNHPTVQVYDQNATQGTLTPDWSTDTLELTPIVYVDAEVVTDDVTEFLWTRIKGSETTEDEMSTSKILRISNNDLDESPTIRYKCTVKYNGKSFFNEITFARVSTGKDGASGDSAPAVKAQYSVDGNSGWTSILNEEDHKYIRLSYDNGATWPSVFKIAGEDGKSVQVKGVAYSETTPVTGEIVALYLDSSTTTPIDKDTASEGDSYLVDGYLCVYNGTDFVCTGQIQGPPGQKGDSYYLFIRYANNASGSGISTSPEGKSYIGFYRSSVNQVPTDVSSATWNWAKFVGEDAKSITLNANAQVFKIDKANAMTPATVTVTAQAINTTIPSSGWTYSIDGGKTFSATAPTGVARSGNVVTLTGASITSNSIVVKASDGTYSDFLTIYKVFDGSDGAPGGKGDSAPIAFLTNENISFAANAQGQVTGTTVYCNVVAYTGTTQVTPTVGTILSTELPTGMSIGTITTVSNQIRIPIVIANNATLGSAQNVNGTINIPITSPVSTTLQLTWSKINSGANGSSASLVDITPSALYFKSTKGKDGVFTPEYIYLYPRFQNATYNGWQYSIDGGVNWVNASTLNGLSIAAHGGIGNSLRISRSSSLYTDTVTSISFRCNTLDPNIYDVVSIAKIYDVADFNIGGRNYVLNSANLSVSGLGSSEGSAMEYKYIDVGQSYMDITNGTEVTISFDLEMTVGTENPTLMVYNTNRRGPKTFAAKTLRFTAAVGDTIKQRCSVVATIIDTESPARTTNAIEFFSTYGTSNWFKISNLKLEKGNQPTDWTPAPEDLIESAANVNVMLSNESHFFEANSNGVPTATSIVLDVVGYKGSIQSITKVGSISGLPSAGMTVTISDNETVNTKITIAVTEALTSTIADYGTLTIPITVNGHIINKKFSWVKAKTGATGTGASLVTINPSALYFKSTNGKDGVFTPEYIYLYPRFQNVTYVGWQYSVDGGLTWNNASGASGLLVTTHNSISNTLRISRTSTLYTDTVTSISFKCLSSNTSVYDTVSIIKIHDVVDLDIGGRNLLYDSTFNDGTTWSKTYGTILEPEVDKPNSKIYHVSHTRAADATAALGTPIYNNKRTYISLKAGESLAVSYDFYTDDIALVGDSVGTLRISTAETGGTVTSLFTSTKAHLINQGLIAGKWQRFNYTYTTTTDLEGWLIFGMYIRAEIGATVSYKFREIKVEKGNRATDWTPAPEDINDNIEKVNTRVTNVFAEVKTTTDSITSRVSSTEESIKTVNTNVTSLTTRVSTAEEKITDDAIVSTVRQSTDYTNDLGKKVSSDEIISTINQTAEGVTISASKIGLLGATNIPDLTADKIKGGTLTLGGSSATTQNGQLLVKNASDVDMVKLNKDGVVVKSGHLAVAEDFENSRYNWEDDSWTTTTNTRQLDLASDYLRMGIYTSSGYSPDMVLSDTGLTFQGSAQGVGSWGSFIGHHWDGLDFVIQDTVRSNISFRGYGDTEMANISGDGFYINGPVSGGITSGNAKQFSNVFTKHFASTHTGYIAIRLGTITRAANSMITIKGHVTSYQNSSSFEASCYFYNTNSAFYGTIATMSNPDVLKEVYFAEGVSDGYVYLIVGGSDSSWNYPTVAIDTLTIGYSGHTAYEWNSGWEATLYSNLSSFTTVTPCARGGMKKTLWSGAIQAGRTISLTENLRNFKYLTCIIGDATTPYGIVLPSMLDDEISELHFFGFTTDSYAASQHYGAKFTMNSQTNLTLVACGTSANNTLYCRKIVGWR